VTQIEQRGVVGKRIAVGAGAVIAPWRDAIDEHGAATVAADMAEVTGGNVCRGRFEAIPGTVFPGRGVKPTRT
jgi:hypothetical protein